MSSKEYWPSLALHSSADNGWDMVVIMKAGAKDGMTVYNGLKLYEIDTFISWTKTYFPKAWE